MFTDQVEYVRPIGVSLLLARSHIAWLWPAKSMALIWFSTASANCMRAAPGAAIVIVEPISR